MSWASGVSTLSKLKVKGLNRMSLALIMAELPSLLKDEESLRRVISFELKEVAVRLAEDKFLPNSSLASSLCRLLSSSSFSAYSLYS